MNIIINGKRAVLKKDSSFEYVSENRLFTDADAYSLSIELPLKGCPENLEIFGNINRTDIVRSSVLLPCELQAPGFVKQGSISITEVTETEVKVQFLEGRSAQNCALDFDEIYINELEIGYNTHYSIEGDLEPIPRSQWPVSKLANSIDSGQEWQALPWVNNYSGNIQNKLTLSSSGASYDGSQVYLSYQCYLLSLTKRIFEAVGYSCNFSAWQASTYRYLLCCNALPAAWELLNYAKALPHWTVTEYVEQLELLLSGEFDINHQTKKVSFAFTGKKISDAGEVGLTRIVNEFTVTQEEESESDYKPATNVEFSSCDHEMWRYYDCSWLIQRASTTPWSNYWLRLKELANTSALIAAIPKTTTVYAYSEDEILATVEQFIYYVKDIKRYYVARRAAVKLVAEGTEATDSNPANPNTYQLTFTIQALNLFAPVIYDEEASTSELKIVPAWLDDLGDLSQGFLLFLDCGEYDNEPTYTVAGLLEKGEDASEEFHDKLYVGFWKGETVTTKYPHPYIDRYDINTDREVKSQAFFSLVPRSTDNAGYYKAKEIKRSYRYDIEFLSDQMPDVRAVFYIRGKRYLCKKITATFTESGMSQLMKGEFYELA